MKARMPESIPCIPAQTCHGVCIGCVDIGSQWSDEYQKFFRQIILTWELPTVRMDVADKNGVKKNMPRVISKTYSNTLGKGLRLLEHIEMWRGKFASDNEKRNYDYSERLGKNCILVIANSPKQGGGTKATVASVAPLMTGMQEKQPESAITDYDMDRDGFDNLPASPPWAADNIRKSKEYKEAMGEHTEMADEQPDSREGGNPDIPF